MLDNLKLGYGGTKSEMERLLADAQKITGVKYDISNLSDVYQAIHVIQGELGITGTTAKEATETLQGSLASMKASWSNFLSGSGNLSQVVDTATDVVKNVVRIANEAIPDIIKNVTNSLPELLQLGSEILNNIIIGIITYLPILMESAGQILNNLAQGIINVLPQLIPVALQVIQMLLTGLISYLPQILQMGIQILSQLISGIAQMLPELIPMAISCIITLVEGLLDNIDQLIDAGIQLIIGLAEGLIYAVPQLIDKIPIIYEKLLQAIIRNLPKIISMGLRLLLEFGAGLIMAIPELVAMIPKIIKAIIDAFFSTNWGEIGKQLLQGLLNGFSSAGNIIFDAIKRVGNSMIDGIKSFFGIHSPSKVFADLGEYLPQGFAVGIEADTDSALKAIDNMNDEIMHEMNRAVAIEKGSISASATVKSNANYNCIIQVNADLNADVSMDKNKVGRIVAPVVTKTIKAGGIK